MLALAQVMDGASRCEAARFGNPTFPLGEAMTGGLLPGRAEARSATRVPAQERPRPSSSVRSSGMVVKPEAAVSNYSFWPAATVITCGRTTAAIGD